MITTYTTTEKIQTTIEKLKQLNKKITVENILVQSLFIPGGTPSEAEIKEYLKKENTDLMILNTDIVKEINFLKFKTIMLKEWNEDKTQCRHSKLNMHLIVYNLKFNFTKKTVQIGDKVFKVKEYTDYAYNFSKNTVKCTNMDSLYKHFKDAANQNNVFHTITGTLLNNIYNR